MNKRDTQRSSEFMVFTDVWATLDQDGLGKRLTVNVGLGS